MFVYNGTDSAVNLDLVSRLFVIGSGSTWGLSAQTDGGSETVAPAGTYSTQAAAQAALQELLDRAGWGGLPNG